VTAVTLAVLAGGEGSRMGRAKGELQIGDEPISAYLLRQIAWDGPTMLVTAPGRERPPGAERFGREVVDPVAGQGPLRGVLTALEHATTPIVVIATVDMPGVHGEHLRWLVERLDRTPDAVGLMLSRGSDVEPFPHVCRAGAADAVRARIESDQLSVRRLVDEARVRADAAPSWPEDVWTNLNRPDDLDAFLRRRSSRADR
jgi:molybdopterin-guanine dinucleotide biosynthesis protein A